MLFLMLDRTVCRAVHVFFISLFKTLNKTLTAKSICFLYYEIARQVREAKIRNLHFNSIRLPFSLPPKVEGGEGRGGVKPLCAW